MYQLKLALQFGDPVLVARSKLYIAIALIQKNNLRAAKHLIRQQYSFAQSEYEVDERLMKMCLGIWLKLQYSYHVRNQTRKAKLPAITVADLHTPVKVLGSSDMALQSNKMN